MQFMQMISDLVQYISSILPRPLGSQSLRYLLFWKKKFAVLCSPPRLCRNNCPAIRSGTEWPSHWPYSSLARLWQWRCVANCHKRWAIPVQALTGHEGCRRLRLQYFKTWHVKVVRLSALRTGRLYPPLQEVSWYSFLLEAESAPGP